MPLLESMLLSLLLTTVVLFDDIIYIYIYNNRQTARTHTSKVFYFGCLIINFITYKNGCRN